MNLQVEDQFLRMSDLANQAAKPETTKTDKTGCKLTRKATPARRGITGFSAKHIYSLIKLRQFPAPIKVGKASLWRLSDINEWIAKQVVENEN